MSERKGKLVTCNRCGTEVFLRYLGCKDLNGGYDHYYEYECLPEEWMYESQIGHLCPECSKVFKSFCSHFMGSTNHNLKVAISWYIDKPLNMQEIYNDIALGRVPIETKEDVNGT